MQSLAAITASGESISRAGARVLPRKMGLGMGTRCRIQACCAMNVTQAVGLVVVTSQLSGSEFFGRPSPGLALKTEKLVGDDGLEPPTFSV